MWEISANGSVLDTLSDELAAYRAAHHYQQIGWSDVKVKKVKKKRKEKKEKLKPFLA